MSSEIDQHLRLYNSRGQSTGSFHAFNRLPNELRAYIWELALPQERLLRIRLDTSGDYGRVPQGQNASVTRLAGNPTYQVILEGRKLIPKLMHVCQEAKYTAQRFYRIQLPCSYVSEGNSDEGICYINPELDILKIRTGRDRERFIQFIKHLQDVDPSRQGLINLALDNSEMGCLGGIQSEVLDDDSRQALVKTLSNLRQIFFLCLETAGRMFLGPLNGVRAIQGWEMHRSRPIMGSVPSFKRLQYDPRPIQEDLKRVFMGTFDPRQMLFSWKTLLQEFKIKERHDVRHNFLVSCTPEEPYASIVDRDSAVKAIRYEDEQWKEGLDTWEKTVGRVDRETQEQLDAASPPAVGFWLFPIDALGQIPSTDQKIEDVESFFKPKRVEDLSEHQPQLGLFLL